MTAIDDCVREIAMREKGNANPPRSERTNRCRGKKQREIAVLSCVCCTLPCQCTIEAKADLHRRSTIMIDASTCNRSNVTAIPVDQYISVPIQPDPIVTGMGEMIGQGRHPPSQHECRMKRDEIWCTGSCEVRCQLAKADAIGPPAAIDSASVDVGT